MHRSFGQIKVSGLNMHRSIHDISGNLHHNRTKSSSKGTCRMYDIRQTSILKINKESTRSQKIRCIRIICLLIINHHLQAATLLHDIVQTSTHAHDFSYQQTITHTYTWKEYIYLMILVWHMPHSEKWGKMQMMSC